MFILEVASQGTNVGHARFADSADHCGPSLFNLTTLKDNSDAT
jgi:hypothetical protein